MWSHTSSWIRRFLPRLDSSPDSPPSVACSGSTSAGPACPTGTWACPRWRRAWTTSAPSSTRLGRSGQCSLASATPHRSPSCSRPLIPSAPEEELQSIARAFRLSVSPGAAAAYIRMNIDVDVCDVLPLLRVPTLVMHRKDRKGWDIRSGRYLAEHIPGARFVELPGADFSPSLGEQEPVFAELESFLAGVVAGTHPEAKPDRVLATVLFSDIVGSSERAATLGDRAWRELLLRHHELVRRQLVR